MRPDRDLLAQAMTGGQALPVMSQPGEDDLLFNWMQDLTQGKGQNAGILGRHRPIGPEVEPLTRDVFRQNKPGTTYPSMRAIGDQMRQEALQRMMEQNSRAIIEQLNQQRGMGPPGQMRR